MCGGARARSKGVGSGPLGETPTGVVLRGFKSRPPHDIYDFNLC